MTMKRYEAGLRKCHILLVEDHDQTARTVQRALCTWLEVRCVPTRTLVEAKRQFDAAATRGDPFDLVICDLVLPDGSGLQLPRMLGLAGAVSAINARAQLIAVSGMIASGDRTTSLEAGFDAHLRKPFSLEELTDTVRALLSRTDCVPDAVSA